ncbi:MAG TPA: 4Fe-4S binding protein [Sumerlaeia bacterium]|nr:4Fe-4S binding protein [Sumerlaeia bacterium]
MEQRKIIRIDDSKCTGCGLCAPACAEGAIQIIDGKARLVSEVYCDGLGACLGECPEGALTIEEREAEPFDPEAVNERLKTLASGADADSAAEEAPAPAPEPARSQGGCPGAVLRDLRRDASAPAVAAARSRTPLGAPLASRLSNWPIQIKLAPLHGPHYANARLVIAADCVAFAYADFHRRFLRNDRPLLIGCPKLDDTGPYVAKLAEIFLRNAIQSVEVVHMEVPCCHGLFYLIKQALEKSGASIPLTTTEIGLRGEERSTVGAVSASR